MTDNETLISVSDDEEEWYTKTYFCIKCRLHFMAVDRDYEDFHKVHYAKFCPYCGRKIVGFKRGNTTTFEFDEGEAE